MPTFLREEISSEPPTICIVGEGQFVDYLVESYKQTGKIIHISSSHARTEKEGTVYKISSASSYLLKNLVERLDYAALFLENRRDARLSKTIVQKLKKDHTKTVIIVPVRTFETLEDAIQEIREALPCSLLFLGDVFGARDYPSEIAQLVHTALRGKSVTVDSLAPIFPISESDALDGLSNALFGPQHASTHFLFYENPQTLGSAVHLLRRVEPDLAVTFQEEGKKTTEENALPAIKQAHRKISYVNGLDGFEKSVSHLFSNRKLSIPENGSRKDRFKKPIGALLRKKKVFPTVLAACLVFLLLNIVLFATGVLFMKESVAHLAKGDLQKAFLAERIGTVLLDAADPTVSVSTHAVSVLSQSAAEDTYHTLREVTSRAPLLLSSLKEISLTQNVIGQDAIERGIMNVLSLYQKAEVLGLEIQNPTLSRFVNEDSSRLMSILPILSTLLGFPKEKTYLILFQNNGELRPTGGFIGSVGELTLRRGRVTNFVIRDVYEADGQLKNHIEPHYIIRRYLQPHLYLRDSSFSLDFQNSASTAALLYHLETGKKVDGVIAVDFEVVRRITEVLGPFRLHEYNVTLDANNAFSFLEDTIDKSKFPGSTQKKDLLDGLFKQIMLSLQDHPSNSFKVLEQMPLLMREKHILFAFQDRSLQNIFDVNGFGGRLLNLRKQETNGVHDEFSLNEANIGVNKANQGVTRRVSYDVFVGKDKLESRATIMLENIGPRSMDYKSYIRIVAPLASTLLSIKFNGVEQNVVPAVTDFSLYEQPGFVPPTGLELDTQTQDKKVIFGFITNVPKNSTQTIEVEYGNGISLPASNVLSYSLLFIKQPGTAPYPLRVAIHYGDDYSPRASLGQNKIISFQENRESDKEFRVELVKK